MNTDEEQIVFLPFFIPLPMYALLEEAANKNNVSVQVIISEAIGDKVKKLGGKTDPNGG